MKFLQVLTLVHIVFGQTGLPRLSSIRTDCLENDINECKMNCPIQYHDSSRYTCPCYSKIGECLVRIGCTFPQRKSILISCTRKGYCKNGYCIYRNGDFTPKNGIRSEIFIKTSIEPPATPCIDGCCIPPCTEEIKMKKLREPSRAYRKEEILLPPRHGDPRLSVNQNYDSMPYSIPLENLPAIDLTYANTFHQSIDLQWNEKKKNNFKILNGTLN